MCGCVFTYVSACALVYMYMCACISVLVCVCTYGQICKAEYLEGGSFTLSVVIASGRHQGDFIRFLEFALFKGPTVHFNFKTKQKLKPKPVKSQFLTQ